MTDEELKALVAENSRAIGAMLAADERRAEELRTFHEQMERLQESQERVWRNVEALREETKRIEERSERTWQEVIASRRESDRIFQSIHRQLERLDEKSEKTWQEMIASRQESGRIFQSIHRQLERLDEKSEKTRQEVIASRRESDRVFQSIHRQLGELGNKQGDYTEALFRPSLERALREQFGMTVIVAPQRIRDHGEEAQFDMIGHARDEIPEVYLVEIKTQLRADAFDQIFEHLRKLPRFLPEHRGKKLFGILAALDVPPDLRTRAAREGLYLATIKDDVFEIVPPDGFEPRAFGLRSLS